MNVKIQGGGGGTYANTGSCTGVVTYLQHEDLERIRQGQQAEPFFNQYRDFVSPKEVTYKIDHNRAQLHKTDAKFFVITVSPSEKELAAMGASPEEQARAMKEYIRKDIIPALNPIFVFSMIKFIFMYQKYVYILLFKTCRNTNLNSPPPIREN